MTERRRYPRVPLVAGVQCRHGPGRQEFPGRCVDISPEGLLMYVPAATPVRVGHTLRVQLGGAERPELGRWSDGPVDATVVRVDRRTLLDVGHVAVGLHLAE